MTKLKKVVASLILGAVSIMSFVEGSYLNKIALGAFLYAIPTSSVAQAPEYLLRDEFENYFLQTPEVIQWQFYLFNRMLEEGLSYKDYEKLKRIFYCESRWRQYDSKGNVLRGVIHPPDTGIAQINLAVHSETLEEMNLDAEDPYDNLDYALFLYQKNGVKDWVCKS